MNNKTFDFYLTSSEGHITGEPRMCFIIRQVRYGVRKDCLLVSIYPPIDGHRYGLGEKGISKVVLAPRFKGDSFFPPNRCPLEVYILRFVIDDSMEGEVFENEDLINMAWGEIYKSVDDLLLSKGLR
jgi:hypothetical protein